MKKLTKEETDILRIDIELNNQESRIYDSEQNIEKLKQSYFTAGRGIIISDNRPMGMDTVDISLDDTVLPFTPAIDDLKSRVRELEKTNKVLAQFIWDNLK